MKALISDSHGIALRDIDRPLPGPHDVLVRVRAASLNRADLYVAQARTGKPFGMEWAGEVVECGSRASLQIGDRVICTGMGGFAEYAVADAGRTIPIPRNYAWDEASALGLGLQTMHDALVTNGRLAAGETVLVHGASTAVGLLALQIARHKGASLIIGTSTSPEKRAQLGAFGAHFSLDPKAPDWVQQVLDATGGKGANLVIDQLAGPGLNDTMRATRHPWPHRQRRPAGRRRSPFQLRPACLAPDRVRGRDVQDPQRGRGANA